MSLVMKLENSTIEQRLEVQAQMKEAMREAEKTTGLIAFYLAPKWVAAIDGLHDLENDAIYKVNRFFVEVVEDMLSRNQSERLRNGVINA